MGEPEWRDFVPTERGVRDIGAGREYQRGPDGRLTGTFSLEDELNRDAMKRLEMAQRVNEAWLRSQSGDEPSMDE